MDTVRLANLLFPHVTKTPEDLLAEYPRRRLPDGAMVTRMAPSPTGFMHIGNLFGALIDERLAHRSGGVFYLRIEDTDAKRAVEGGVEGILRGFARFGLRFDEGAKPDGEPEVGDYGPYRQSRRASIYHVFAKRLTEKGLAYPCFCSHEALEDMRAKQEAAKENFGYYGKWAACRDLSPEEIEKRLAAGEPHVLRLRSPGNPENRIVVEDLARGTLSVPENDQDIVLLKSDGIPTYHFAHAVDDTLMGTTHVVRGEEWLATLPVHIQLFSVLGFEPPIYIHTPTVMKAEGSGKRKLSKRKDPEAALDYYIAHGYHPRAVLEYLMTLLNSGFEDWRTANPDKDFEEYPFDPRKLSASGALFDLQKLNDVSKNVISRMRAEAVYESVTAWAREFDPAFCELLGRDPEYAKRIFAIDRGGPKPRKDLVTWADAKDYVSYFYDETFAPDYTLPENVCPADAAEIVRRYAEVYDPADDKETWFARMKETAARCGFHPNVKEYKKNPEGYKGHVGDFSAVIRIAVTGRRNAPDLHAVMAVLGGEKIRARLKRAEDVFAAADAEA